MFQQIENVTAQPTVTSTVATLVDLGVINREQVGKAFRTSPASICRKFNEGGDFWSEDLRNALHTLPAEAVEQLKKLFPLAKEPEFKATELDGNGDGWIDEDDLTLAACLEGGALQQEAVEKAIKISSAGSSTQHALIEYDLMITRHMRQLKRKRAILANQGKSVAQVDVKGGR